MLLFVDKPPFKTGDRVVPIDHTELWARDGYRLTVQECRPSTTHPGWAIVLQVQTIYTTFQVVHSAEYYKLR